MPGATLTREPALVYLTVLSAVAGIVIKVFHLTPDQAHAAVVVAGAVGTIITAALARPADVAVITGAASTAVSSLAAFGLHLSPGWSAVILAAVGFAAGQLGRVHLSPIAHLQPAVRDS